MKRPAEQSLRCVDPAFLSLVAMLSAGTIAPAAFAQGSPPPPPSAPTPEAVPPQSAPDAANAEKKPAETEMQKARAEDPIPTPNYSGDLWTRSTLTGDWWGARNTLATNGITFDLGLTQVGQGVVGGGKNPGWEYDGREWAQFNLDTTKAGLWPGGFLTIRGEGTFGHSVNGNTGALIPVNINPLIPEPGENQFLLPGFYYAQFLSDNFGIVLGKLTTITNTAGDMNEFAHGLGDTGFLNVGFSFNPAIALTVPYSTLGAGMIILPSKDLAISLSAVDSNGEADTAGFNTLFDGATSYVAEGRLTTNFFDMTGHQLVGGVYSTKNYTSLNQDFHGIIEGLPVGTADSSWCVYYNFDQFVYEPEKGSGQGVGLFGRFGASDGKANPIHYFYSLGVGGKGLIPGRDLDRYGLGFYYMDIANGNVPSTLRFGDEHGIEAFYEIALTPWMHFTPDIQVVDPSKENTDTAVVVGVRLTLTF